MKQPKIALITANIGGIDEVIAPVTQGIAVDYFCYTEDNLPFPLVHFDNRMKSKYVKLQTHYFLPEYDFYIWVDGRVEVLSEDFAKWILDNLSGNDIAIPRHPQRENVYEEMDFILQMMEEGNKYLLDRYANQPIKEELELFRKKGIPAYHPLYACGVFARANKPLINEFFNEWWRHCIRYSSFDQSMMSFLSWRLGIRVSELPYNNPYIQINKHK